MDFLNGDISLDEVQAADEEGRYWSRSRQYPDLLRHAGKQFQQFIQLIYSKS